MSTDTKKILQLKYSIPFKTETGNTIQLDQLEFGRVKAKHMKLLPSNFFSEDNELKGVNPSDLFPLIAGLCNLPLETVEELDFDDILSVCEVVTSFLLKPQEPIGIK